MRIAVGGIGAAGNLGAPALGITLKKELERKYGKCEITLIMPQINKEYFIYQNEYAKKYGMKIYTYYNISDLLETLKYGNLSVKKVRNIMKELHQYSIFLKSQDCFIEISGIAYYDIGKGGGATLRDFSDYFYCKLFRIPYIRFVQSFGPMKDKITKFFAKYELNDLSVIFARGNVAKKNLRECGIRHTPIYVFPDIALKLPNMKDKEICCVLGEIGLRKKEYIIISPSIVMYQMKSDVSNCAGEKYVLLMLELIKMLCNKGEKILILPHTYAANARGKSDVTICNKLMIKISNNDFLKKNVFGINRPLDVYETKGVISASKLVIVSRYHALVAALSTCTPCIVVGWNNKYEDLLRYYHLEDRCIDVTKEKDVEVKLKRLVNQCYEEVIVNNKKCVDMEKQNVRVIHKVDQAFRILWKIIDEICDDKIE